jgi:hypothetical protein
MSIRLPFANLSRLLAALAFGIVLMTASSCEHCEEDACNDDNGGHSPYCCRICGAANCWYQVGFRDGSGNLQFVDVTVSYFCSNYKPPSGFTCGDKISESCVQCPDGRSCP